MRYLLVGMLLALMSGCNYIEGDRVIAGYHYSQTGCIETPCEIVMNEEDGAEEVIVTRHGIGEYDIKTSFEPSIKLICSVIAANGSQVHDHIMAIAGSPGDNSFRFVTRASTSGIPVDGNFYFQCKK